MDEHEWITGEVINGERCRVLNDRIGVSASDIKAIEEILRDPMVVPTPHDPHPLDIKDPDDKWILATAGAGNADVLVTGDSDLQEVASQAPLRIMTPRDFWNMTQGGSGR